MLNELLTLYRELPESQRGTVLAAFVAVAGVLGTAIFTLLTAVVNAMSTVVTRNLTSKHEHMQWRRERIWQGYIKTIDNFGLYANFYDDLRLKYIIEIRISLEDMLTTKYPQHFKRSSGLLRLLDYARDEQEQLDYANKKLREMRYFANEFVGGMTLVATEAVADRKYSELRQEVKDFVVTTDTLIQRMISDLFAIIKLAENLGEEPDLERIAAIKQGLRHLGIEYSASSDYRDKIFELKAKFSDRMARL